MLNLEVESLKYAFFEMCFSGFSVVVILSLTVQINLTLKL